MKRTHTVFLSLGIGAGVIVFVIVLTASFAWLFFGARLDSRQSMRERAKLLYELDHHALLAECRSIMTNRNVSASYWSRGPDYPNVPAAIKRLKPRQVTITITHDEVNIELHGGFDHYGVIARSEAAMPKSQSTSSWPFELIPGLYYYDEGFAYDQEAWIKKLKEMKPNQSLQRGQRGRHVWKLATFHVVTAG